MNRTVLAVLVVVAALGGGLYLYQAQQPAPPPPQTVEVPSPEPPAPRYPVPTPPQTANAPTPPEAPEPSPDTPESAPEPSPSEPPLPALGESDGLAQRALQESFAVADALSLFNLDGVIRRLVVTVDNLPRARLPHKRLVVETAPGPFLVTGDGEDEYFIHPDNHRRYTPYVRLLESLDTDTFARLYVRYYPLLQAAYTELGYPDAYFNDRLVAVIDHLLATPEVERPVRLVRPHVLYKYADPQLEALSAGQKTLIRIGPDNAGRVRAKLQELRSRLVGLAEVPVGD